MGFDTEPTGFEKTILSDLQGAWQCLRGEVAENLGFDGWERALFHIDAAMSWESVRNLRQMQRSLLLVRNILQRAVVSEGVAECLEAVSALMDETLESASLVCLAETGSWLPRMESILTWPAAAAAA